MTEKIVINNGHDYVDLKLPSGTLWSTCNVGANKPSDAGLYFQWADIKGYTAEQVGVTEEQKPFTRNDYKWYPNNEEDFIKYNAKGALLELCDDAAFFNMAGEMCWHMPSPSQIQELIDNTTNNWITLDGVNGKLFTSKKDSCKSIFIPAAGYAYGGSVQDSGTEAYVWSSMLNTDVVDYGQNLSFDSDNAYLSSNGRYCGFSVCGVIG